MSSSNQTRFNQAMEDYRAALRERRAMRSGPEEKSRGVRLHQVSCLHDIELTIAKSLQRGLKRRAEDADADIADNTQEEKRAKVRGSSLKDIHNNRNVVLALHAVGPSP